jgi:uncharacterized protein (TIGR02598 family)
MKKCRPGLIEGFTLVEVVLALGVVSFALVAILGVFPIGLQTGHDAQDETRAAQIAQAIFATMLAQAPTRYSAIQIPIDASNSLPLNLSQTNTPATPQMYADNDGKFTVSKNGAIYAITITTSTTPPGIGSADAGLASQVIISISWPAAAPAANRTQRNFVEIISKY